jgi:L-ascorbate metabolism protein UlaG (beta-lactamase superfamily)
MKKVIGSIFLIIIGLTYIFHSSLGSRADNKRWKEFETSKQFNKVKGMFENRKTAVVIEMKKVSINLKIMKDWLSGGHDRVPTQKMVQVKPDLAAFLKPSNELKTIWFGHSSFLLNMDGKIVLVDPVFSVSASPFSFLIKRFQKLALELHELPEIDYILISHDHYDHLDTPTVKYFINKKTKFITPLGVGSHLMGWGVDKDRIIEKDWWETASFDGIDFIATPAQHFSGRDGFDDNQTLWASWVLKSKNHNIYFSGDSGYDKHFKDIGDRYGPFDIAFLENGQYDKRWPNVHMFPKEAVLAFKDLNAKKLFPIHWGMFQLALHSWYDPIQKILKLAEDEGIPLIVPKLGEIVTLGKYNKVDQWWNESIIKRDNVTLK